MMEPILTRWWWIRHAPVKNLVGLSGHLDRDADTSDRAGFERLSVRLPRGAVYVTSHLRRTSQTLSAIADALGDADDAMKAPLIEQGFAEQCFGDWQGMTWEEVSELKTPQSEAFWQDPAHGCPPGGEAFSTVCERVSTAVERINQEFAGRDIVVVGHAGSIRAAVAMALDLTPHKALALAVDNLSLTRIDHLSDGLYTLRGGHWRLPGFNQVM